MTDAEANAETGEADDAESRPTESRPTAEAAPSAVDARFRRRRSGGRDLHRRCRGGAGQRARPGPADDHEAAAAALAATADDSPPQAERATTRVMVTGLVSVASIATFKRSLGRVPGVSTIGVASGPDGEFVFTVSHDAGIGLGDAIVALPGFEAR